MQLLHVLVGQPQTRIDPTAKRDPEWTSAIWKSPVDGPVRIGPLGLDGDAVANPAAHGGIDKAVMAYSADWADAWAADNAAVDTSPGAFGENLFVAGADETTVCLGDRWQVGGVELEVSHPRQPCWKLARRQQLPELPKRVVQTHRSGWYLRVLGEGEIAAGQTLERIAQPHPDWPLSRVATVFYGLGGTADDAKALRSLPVLAAAWRDAL